MQPSSKLDLAPSDLFSREGRHSFLLRSFPHSITPRNLSRLLVPRDLYLLVSLSRSTTPSSPRLFPQEWKSALCRKGFSGKVEVIACLLWSFRAWLWSKGLLELSLPGLFFGLAHPRLHQSPLLWFDTGWL